MIGHGKSPRQQVALQLIARAMVKHRTRQLLRGFLAALWHCWKCCIKSGTVGLWHFWTVALLEVCCIKSGSALVSLKSEALLGGPAQQRAEPPDSRAA